MGRKRRGAAPSNTTAMPGRRLLIGLRLFRSPTCPIASAKQCPRSSSKVGFHWICAGKQLLRAEHTFPGRVESRVAGRSQKPCILPTASKRAKPARPRRAADRCGQSCSNTSSSHRRTLSLLGYLEFSASAAACDLVCRRRKAIRWRENRVAPQRQRPDSHDRRGRETTAVPAPPASLSAAPPSSHRERPG